MVDVNTVKKLAQTAQIELSEDEYASLAKELRDLTPQFELLQEVDTTGVSELSSIGNEEMLMRLDEVNMPHSRDDILQNADDTTQGFYTVPKVIDNE